MSESEIALELKDFNKLRATIERKFGALVTGPVPKALRSVGEVWMTEAKKRCPVDKGVLRSSGHVQGPIRSGNNIIVKLVFGGPSAGYARVVHENLTAKHKVGQAKYLESVVLERRNRLTHEVVAFIGGGARVHGALFS